ncbi:MAG: hypothetical protein NWF07_10920 [Candidatus Bathyarchaeota archaeon]|nr:hypothetical protein [Candidatus Bathyarchaeota archaeon]
MSWEPKNQQQFLIALGFVLLVLCIVPVGYRGLLFVILHFRDNNSYDFFRNIFSLFSFIISILVVVSGFWFGRRVDLSRNYRKFLNGLGVSWVLAIVFLGCLWFFTEDMTRAVYEISVMRALTGYSYLAPLFSGITLGWLVKERPTIKTEWNRDILRYVVFYQGALLVRALISNYIAMVYLYRGRNIELYGLFSWTSSLVLVPINLWYLWKMFETGKTVELDNEYGSILFTLWVPRVIVSVLISVTNMVMHQTPIIDMLINSVEDIIVTSISVFGVAFAVLCLGYIHSRYMFVEELERIRGVEN